MIRACDHSSFRFAVHKHRRQPGGGEGGGQSPEPTIGSPRGTNRKVGVEGAAGTAVRLQCRMRVGRFGPGCCAQSGAVPALAPICSPHARRAVGAARTLAWYGTRARRASKTLRYAGVRKGWPSRTQRGSRHAQPPACRSRMRTHAACRGSAPCAPMMHPLLSAPSHAFASPTNRARIGMHLIT